MPSNAEDSRAGLIYCNLELQTSFAGSIGKCLVATMESITGTIKSNFDDTSSLCFFSNGFAYFGSSVFVLEVFQAIFDVSLKSLGGSKNRCAVRSKNLGVNVLAGTQDRQTSNTQITDVAASGFGATNAGDFL